MRLILFTGKGGAGASTLAAATAVALAGGGRRTLAFGVGHGLAAAFGRPLGQRPVPLAADLWALEATPGRHDEPGPVLDWLRDLFAYRNMDETVADDIAALPGLVDLARLLALDEQAESGQYDAAVVDFPALRHTLDLLSGRRSTPPLAPWTGCSRRASRLCWTRSCAPSAAPPWTARRSTSAAASC
jgi:arsenite-transporting ATPase